MTKNLMSNVQFQLRLVKELRGSPGRHEIITLPFLGKSKEGAKDDHTLRGMIVSSAVPLHSLSLLEDTRLILLALPQS